MKNKYRFTYSVYFNKEKIAKVTAFVQNENMFCAFDDCKAKANETYPRNEGYTVGALFIAAEEYFQK